MTKVMELQLPRITIESFPPLPELEQEGTEYHGKPPPSPSPTSPSNQYRHDQALEEYTPTRCTIVPDTFDIRPLSWIWTCQSHDCKGQSAYSLGVTRRCLSCGHYFCSGQQWVRPRKGGKGKRKLKGCTPCSTQFDYHSWARHMEWKQKRYPDMVKDGCLGCTYPSECMQRKLGRNDWQEAVTTSLGSDVLRNLEKKASFRDQASKAFTRLAAITEESEDVGTSAHDHSGHEKDRDQSSSTTKNGRGKTSNIIQRVVKNAERRTADMEALTRSELRKWTLSNADNLTLDERMALAHHIRGLNGRNRN